MKYRVSSFGDRASRVLSVQPCATIASATRLFMREARAHASDRNACVTLTRALDANSGTVLAHKSTDSDRVIFEPGYWRES